MTDKEYELARVKLNRYREMLGKVSRLTEEAARWNAMAEITATDCRQTGAGSRTGHRDMGALKSSALTIEKERDALVVKAMEERQQLLACIAMVGSSAYRDILEWTFIGGSSIREVADALEVTERTVTRRIRRAVQLLAEFSDFFASA